YRYDRSHRLVSYLCYQDGEALRGGHYCYDPLGRRIGKQVVQRNQPKHISWFGWDGDKLVLTERDGTRIHTVYLPHSFVPLLRFEGDKPPIITPLADKLEQEVGIALPPDFKHTLHHIELALRANRLSTEQHAWLNQVQLSPDYLTTLLDPLPDTPYAAQLYDCNHLGTPQQLINLNGQIDWSITLDAWGNAFSEENPHQLHQPIRMQGQQYDEESGLHYNRHRYYDPTIGRYITQDPIGLDGGMSFYSYPVDPLQFIDPLGLTQTAQSYVVSRDLSALGEESRSRWNPLTHTFTVTTDSKGNILHTYSWGNSANLKGWNLDQPIDIKTAREALDNNLAQPTLASSSCVEQAYKKLNKKENEHVNLFITRNCKQETNNLLFEAMAICTKNTWGASPFPPKLGMYGYLY
ncbi:RHS repeat-associated core domain-containing protein, partial [Hafnia alvei]|uniref:RHS repeat-associated core domain-containing protein n=1 Tax=Hafnia alvei TaxID=569 RepID=UPI0024A97260